MKEIAGSQDRGLHVVGAASIAFMASGNKGEMWPVLLFLSIVGIAVTLFWKRDPA